MLDILNKNLADYTECELLTLSTMLSSQILCAIKDIDTLNSLANLITAVGTNLTLAATQRDRITSTAKDA